MNRSVQTLVNRLGLEPHAEGGYYREIYRSATMVKPGDDRPIRSAATTIYFLLAAGQHSAWHRVRSDEIWHFYQGDPLQLFVGAPAMDRVETITLDQLRPVYVVPADWWQAARPMGEFTLTGCTVAPGFEFTDFAMLRDEPSARDAIERIDGSMMELI